jgi:AraC family transcriptional activator of pobA
MRSSAPIAVAFREVRHFKPDDCLHCEPVEVRGQLHDWTIPAHRHEGLHQFQLLERGAVEAALDAVSHRIAAPAAFMIPPGCVHAFAYAPDCSGLQVTVPSALLQQAFAGAPALAARLATVRLLHGEAMEAAAGSAHALFAALRQEFEQAASGRMEALQAHAVLLATWFLRQSASEEPEEARRALRDTLVQRYRALLELHLRRHRPLGFYADALKVTPDHLSRTCRAVTGQSALDLLHDRMLLEARRLLAYTDAAVVDIARELGYADPAYFSRFFTRRAGRSPLAYRSALQSGKAVQP